MDEEKRCDMNPDEAKPDKDVKAAKAELKEGVSEEVSKEENTAEENQKEPAEENIEEVKKAADERYARLMAEFQNYKKRTAKEKQDIHAYANEKLVKELLEIVDNFERALTLMEKDDDKTSSPEEGGAMLEGVQLIFTQLKDVLGKAGLKEIEALGSDFNPEFHHAVINEQTEEYDSGKVSRVLQKGYTLNERVIRPAMVAVAE